MSPLITKTTTVAASLFFALKVLETMESLSNGVLASIVGLFARTLDGLTVAVLIAVAVGTAGARMADRAIAGLGAIIIVVVAFIPARVLHVPAFAWYAIALFWFGLVGPWWRRMPIRRTVAIGSLACWACLVGLQGVWPALLDQARWSLAVRSTEFVGTLVVLALAIGFGTPLRAQPRAVLAVALLVSFAWLDVAVIMPEPMAFVRYAITGSTSISGLWLETFTIFLLAYGIGCAFATNTTLGAALALTFLGAGSGSFGAAATGLIVVVLSHTARDRTIVAEWEAAFQSGRRWSSVLAGTQTGLQRETRSA